MSLTLRSARARPLPVGALTLAKIGVILGAYSGNNYDANVKSAWERTGSLTDGFAIEQGKRKKPKDKAHMKKKTEQKDAENPPD